MSRLTRFVALIGTSVVVLSTGCGAPCETDADCPESEDPCIEVSCSYSTATNMGFCEEQRLSNCDGVPQTSDLEDDLEGGCRDEFDNDGDGLLDCFDPDCEPTRGSCQGECGDGTVQGWLGEACDDGNTTDGDGCSHQCAAE